MRRIAIGLGLVLTLLGCSASLPPPRGAQVPLLTDEAPGQPSFANVVIDVVADPETGTPVIEFQGVPMRWPKGFTAWRVGSETEVLDLEGNRVLVTGHRYRLYPGYSPEPYRVIAFVEPYPPQVFGSATCVLGFHQQGDY